MINKSVLNLVCNGMRGLFKYFLKQNFRQNILRMTEHGAALQTYNQELVKFLESIKTKKNEILDIMCKEEAECVLLEKNIRNLQEKLNTVTRSFQHHREIYTNYEKLISETENGFKKILESSQALLQVAQQEIGRLDSDLSTPRNGTTTVVFQKDQENGDFNMGY